MASALPPKILRLTMTVGETSAPYNQFTLPQRQRQVITLCSFQPATVTPPADLTFVEGDGTIPGFWRQITPLLRQEQYDLIHIHDAVVANLYLLMILATNLRLLTHSIFTVHNSYENFKLRNRLLLVPIFLLFRKVICCSKASYVSFPLFYRWLAGSRLTYVQNGMDLERVDQTVGNAATAQTHPRAEQPFTIISVGRLIDIKNPLTLLNAFIASELPTARLVFVGVGPLRELLQARAEAAGVADRVEFTGLIARNAVYQRLVMADLFVSTSYGEGLPIAVLEAMACRTPVVLSAIAPHHEITEALAGIPLIEPNDQRGFAQAIQQFAAMSPEERTAMGLRCRNHVDDYFSLTQMHRGYDAIFGEVMGSGGSGVTRPSFG